MNHASPLRLWGSLLGCLGPLLTSCEADAPSTATAAGGSGEGSGGEFTSGPGGAPGSESGAGAGSREPADGLGSHCPEGAQLGQFEVMLESAFTMIRGKVMDRVVERTMTTTIASDVNCRLVRAEFPHCSPECDTERLCSSSSECVAHPKSQSLGTVEISGLLAPAVMNPVNPGNNYFVSGSAAFPHPGFEAGAAIALKAEGADLPGFTLNAIGVDPLIVPNEDWLIERGKPMRLTWEPGSVAEAQMRITLLIDQHGSTPVTLECATTDSGGLEIPSPLVDALLDAGLSGFPSGNLYRETVDATMSQNGCIQLVVGAHVLKQLEVAGYTPCHVPSDCPAGTTCNEVMERCE